LDFKTKGSPKFRGSPEVFFRQLQGFTTLEHLSLTLEKDWKLQI